MSKILKLNGGGSTYKKKKKKKSSSSYQGPHTGGYPSKKIKTTKPISSGVDPGLAAAVANQAAKNAAIAADKATGKFSSSPASTAPSGFVDIGYGAGQVDPKLAAAVGSSGLVQGDPWVSTSGWKAPSGTGTTIVPPLPDEDLPPEDGEEKDDDKLTEEEEKEEEKKQKALKTAKELTDWWAKHSKDNDLYEHYRERKNIFTGKLWGSQEAVTAKLQDKLNKGYYKIVQGPKGEPLIIHASTGTPVNPYTGNIIDTQSQSAQGGGYQNEMARITGIDPKNAGVFSTEYQRGNGLSVSEMKPEHALRFLMKKNPKAFEEFFNLQKSKGFNPFSLSAIGTGMNAVLSKLFGSDALKVGNNLEKHGWGKSIKDEETGEYSIQLTRKGANEWSKTFNVPEYVSPDAIAKDKEKGWLSDLLGTRKFPDQPIDLTNLIDQGGYQQGTGQTMGFAGSGLIPATQVEREQGFFPENLKTIAPQVDYGYPTIPGATGTTGGPVGMGVDPVTGAPIQTGTTSYPRFTPDGYRIDAYNPSRDYSGGTGQTRTGDGSQTTTGDDGDDTTTQGPLTFDVYGRPIKKYDYTGGPEQLYLRGGWKRDGQYIGSPWGTHHFKSGGIANFKPYGY